MQDGKRTTSQPGHGDDGFLMVVGSGDRRFREYIFREACRHYPLWLMAAAEPDWERPYVAGWTLVDMADHTDPRLLLEAAEQVAAAHRIRGVFCFEEGLIWLAAHVTARLRLPGMTPDVVWRCRDKASTRAVLRRAGIAQPDSVVVGTLEEASAAARRMGFPLIFKPRALGGSVGIRRVDDERDLVEAFHAAATASDFCPGAPTFRQGVIVETYLDGPEVTVDSAVFNGRIQPLVVTRKQTACDPYFEDGCHLIDGFDPLLDDPELLGQVRAVHNALGVTDGATLTQWRLTTFGPRLIEINARLGGDLLPYLGGVATGTNPVRAAVDIAAGVRPCLDRQPTGSAVISFLYPARDLMVRSLSVDGELPPGVHVELLVAPGTHLRLPPSGFKSRYGYVSAQADTLKSCIELVELAKSRIRLDGAPLEDGLVAASSPPSPGVVGSW